MNLLNRKIKVFSHFYRNDENKKQSENEFWNKRIKKFFFKPKPLETRDWIFSSQNAFKSKYQVVDLDFSESYVDLIFRSFPWILENWRNSKNFFNSSNSFHRPKLEILSKIFFLIIFQRIKDGPNNFFQRRLESLTRRKMKNKENYVFSIKAIWSTSIFKSLEISLCCGLNHTN